MNNVLMIIIDSVFEEVLNSNPDMCPFLCSMLDHSLCFKNVFAQGPYTEAGTKGLLCSENTLENEAYLFRYSKASHFISSIFKDEGYETTSIIYPSTLYNKQIVDKLDHIYHTSVFLPSIFWDQKLLFYKDILKNRPFTDAEYDRISELINDVLFYWLYSLDMENYPENKDLFEKYDRHYPYKQMYDYVFQEKCKFDENNRAYVDQLFATDGAALKKDTFSDTNFIKSDALKKALTTKKSFCRRLVSSQRKLAMKQIKDLRLAIKNCRTEQEKMQYIKIWLSYMKESKDIYELKKSDDFKLLLSASSQLDFAAGCLLTDSDKPQFVMVHVEEPHHYNSFVSYDSDDVKMLEEEFDYAKEYLDSIDMKTYKGSLYYDLSVRYVDLQIKNTIEKLRRNGKLDNTTVLITADHGSSYTGRFLRSNRVINFHKENFHIPFILYNPQYDRRTFSELASNIDVIPTLLQKLGLRSDESLSGHDIVSEDPRKCVFIEYMGSGCPDIHLRPVWLAVRNDSYQIAYIGKLSESFNEKNIVSIFNLKEDPNELINYCDANSTDIDNDEFRFLKSKLIERYNLLKQKYQVQ